MAQTLACQSDDGNAATFIGTNLDTGESVTLCPPCLLQFCGTIVEGMTGLPVNELLKSGPVDDDEIDIPHPDDEPDDRGHFPGCYDGDGVATHDDSEHSPVNVK